MAAECGGGTEIRYDPTAVIVDSDPKLRPLLRVCEHAVRFFCVGEAISIPLLRATWHKALHPLPRGVLGRIVKDEAAHGMFGFTVLDWAADDLDATDRAHLARMADLAIDFLEQQWEDLRRRPSQGTHEAGVLGWMQTNEYLAAAHKALEREVREPLLARGLPLRDRSV